MKESLRIMNQNVADLHREMVQNDPRILNLRASNKKLRTRAKQLEVATHNCRANVVTVEKSNVEARESVKDARTVFFRQSVRNQQLQATVDLEEDWLDEYQAIISTRTTNLDVESTNRGSYLDTLNTAVHLILRRLPDDEHHQLLADDIEETLAVCMKDDAKRRKKEAKKMDKAKSKSSKKSSSSSKSSSEKKKKSSKKNKETSPLPVECSA